MENYEQKYKEAIEKAKKELQTCGSTDCDAARQIFRLFPELKESEDERIRNEIIQSIQDNMCIIHKDKCIAWLEKQKEENFIDKSLVKEEAHRIAWEYSKHYDPLLSKESWCEMAALDMAYWLEKQCKHKSQGKSALEVWKDMRFEVYQQASNNRHEPNYSDDSTKMFSLTDIDEIFEKVAEKQGEQNPADKVEPKFKVGDWIIYDRNDSSRVILYVYDIRDGRYYFNDNVHFSWSVKECDEKSHLWTIQDAKDGDVLTDRNYPCIFKSTNEENVIFAYCGINGKGNFATKSESEDNVWDDNPENYSPATKEQRDMLEKAMLNAGYKWDAEKKELKKIEQKPSWNEEDNKNLNSIKWIIENSENLNKVFETIDSPEYIKKYFIDWLKSLKDRVQPKQEWSEDDSWMLNVCCNAIDSYKEPVDKYLVKKWLKSLKPQQKQEWSVQDEAFLGDAIYAAKNTYSEKCGQEELIDWLKSFKPNHWKPSDEQMEALNAINTVGELSYVEQGDLLVKLYQDLKKL